MIPDLVSIVFGSGLGALIHALLYVAGFAAIKNANSFVPVLGVSLVMIMMSVTFSFAMLMMQGYATSWDMLLPGGQYFQAMAFPTLINSVISVTVIMTSAYVILVGTGKQNHV